MAKYQIKHKCGHLVEVVLFGKHADRAKRIDYLEKNKSCLECWKKENRENNTLPNIMVRQIPNDPENLEMIYYGNTYWMRHELKSWGFQFSEFELDAIGMENTPTGWIPTAKKGWSKIMPIMEVAAAVRWLKGEDYQVDFQSGISAIAAYAVEGKPDKIFKNETA